MTTLRELQTYVGEAVRRESPIVDDVNRAKDAARFAAGNGRLSPAAQLDIYREQFWLRHVNSLQEDYGTLVALLGDGGFMELSRAYFGAMPPCDWSLRNLGARLPAFVAANAPWSTDVFLAECAHFEWAFMEAFDAKDSAPFDPACIEGASEDDWDRATLRFHPSLRLVHATHPVHEFRAAVRRGEVPARPQPSLDGVRVAVHRTASGLTTTEVAELPARLLAKVMAGVALAPACEAVVVEARGSIDEAAMAAEVSRWFQEWTGRGWLVGVTFSDGLLAK